MNLIQNLGYLILPRVKVKYIENETHYRSKL